MLVLKEYILLNRVRYSIKAGDDDVDALERSSTTILLVYNRQNMPHAGPAGCGGHERMAR